jgi:hypothetical protein
MEMLSTIANPSVEDAGSIFVVDFIADVYFGAFEFSST